LLEQGQLDVLVESETTRLNAGDTTVVQSNLPHIVSNPGDTTAVGLAVFTPAIWFPNNRRSFNRGGET
ncbi:cupin domain-containing protein, partial [Gemmiger formicilis]